MISVNLEELENIDDVLEIKVVNTLDCLSI